MMMTFHFLSGFSFFLLNLSFYSEPGLRTYEPSQFGPVLLPSSFSSTFSGAGSSFGARSSSGFLRYSLEYLGGSVGVDSGLHHELDHPLGVVVSAILADVAE